MSKKITEAVVHGVHQQISTSKLVFRTSTTKSYEKNKHRLLVIGGSGFVGSNILQRAVQKGIEVKSFNRTGKPTWQDVPWIEQVDWIKGDAFDQVELEKAMDGITGVG
jgi:nucleoside-diphosphate-sugar epimerase